MDTTSLFATNYSEYQHSEVVDPSKYETKGFCSGFVLRRRFDNDVAVTGCEQARIDWARMVGLKSTRAGCENTTIGSFATVCLPMIMPERMWITGYIFECTF